jgi:diguanylate cyclase (GGDEF)-like protein
MDLDHLLSINEKYGHVGGDAWLKCIGKLFGETFNTDGLVARWGGDEFLAAVRSKDLQGLFEQAEAFRQQIEKERPEIMVVDQPVRPGTTVALGLATYPLHAGEINELIEKATRATYRAKEAGGNRVCFYQEKDTLTGLLNYYGGMSALEEALLKAGEKRDSLSIILIDIDRFKEINDEYGHRAGDELLKRLAHILLLNFKDVGTPVRTGGDEFLVVLPAQRADSAFILAEEVRKVVEDSPIKLTIGDRTINLHFQITGGVATFPGDGASRVDLLRKADEALYRAKRTGRNRICLPTSAQMVTKTSHFTQTQLERLGEVARKLDRSEAFLLREALDDLLRKYSDEGG